MQIPTFVYVNDKQHASKDDTDTPILTSYSASTDETPYEEAKYWKGVIVDSTNSVIARAFQHSKTEVATKVSGEDQLYTLLYEATVLYFYRYEGKPMIATFRRTDISKTKSRVSTGKTFFELVKEAIASWDQAHTPYRVADHLWGCQRTPQKWEELCIDGFCNVFLLLDTSNQMTNLSEIGAYAYPINKPLLLHAITLSNETPEMKSYLYPPTLPGDSKYSEYRYHIPKVTLLTLDQANKYLSDGGAVVGFNPLTPDITVKYISPQYQKRVTLAGETREAFNRVYRWHELMDKDEEEAKEYLSVIPKASSMSWETMLKTNERFNEESADYLMKNVINRYQHREASLDKNIYNLVKDILIGALSKMKSRCKKADIKKYIITELRQLKYKEQHTIHARIMKMQRE